MRNQKVALISLAIVIGAVFCYLVSNRTSSPSTPQVGTEHSEQSPLPTQTLTEGAVTYRVRPQNLTPAAPTWDFNISLDTHTGSLDQDLVTLIRLVDDQGTEHKAIGWEGDPPGGHHREGILKFSPLTPRPAFIEVGIPTTGGTEKTNLRWNI